MEVVHIIEQWSNGDNQVLEIHANTISGAKSAYLQRCRLGDIMCRINHVNYDHDVFIYPDEVCTMERLSEHVFVATWELKTRVSA